MVNLKHASYYIWFILAAMFFAAHLAFGSSAQLIGDDTSVKTTAAITMFVVLFISQTERDYLVRTVSLRVVMGLACALGFIAVLLLMR